jgi:hypothetical protein
LRKRNVTPVQRRGKRSAKIKLAYLIHYPNTFIEYLYMYIPSAVEIPLELLEEEFTPRLEEGKEEHKEYISISSA